MAKAGDRVRYIQFTDSMYNAPAQPFMRSRAYLWRFRGTDAGTLSGRQIIETREETKNTPKNYWKANGLTQPEQV